MILDNIKKVIIWGDSLARGIIYDASRKKYSITSECAVNLTAERLGIEIVNRARMGMNAASGLEMIENDLERGMRADVSVIEFGGNDCDFKWNEISAEPDADHQPATPLKIFDEKLRDMIKKLRDNGIKPILASLPPIIPESYFNFVTSSGLSTENILRWLGDKNRIYRHHELYSAKIGKIAADCGCMLLDLRTAFLERRDSRDLMCCDGIHPNLFGQKLISDIAVAAVGS